MLRNHCLLPAVWSALFATTCIAQEKPSAETLAFFENQVRPILAEHCYECHSAKSEKLQAGLRLDHIDLIRSGGDSGPAIDDKSRDSLLLQAVRYENFEMPPNGKLSAEQLSVLERWVEMGSPWPEEAVPEMGAASVGFDLNDRMQKHWIWQARQRTPLPSVAKPEWMQNSIDAFVLQKLDEKGLTPNPEADRATLVRRVYLDLIGLPPSPDELQTALQDEEPDWYERVVDRLLASPHLGVRWGRHWLDLVRYAESRGHEFDEDIPAAFQYRDYIVRTLNDDVPYDQFIHEHVAGDLIQKPRLNRATGWNESVLGTGFWHLGESVHSPVDTRKDETDRFDNMIDVFSKSFLGLTVSCARCHDHKFDAISTADYYSLYGFLQSCDFRQVRFETWQEERQSAEQLATLRSEHAKPVRSSVEQFLTAIEEQLVDEVPSLEPLRSIITRPVPAPLPVEHGLVRVDYRSEQLGQWFTDGVAYGDRPRQQGEFGINVENGNVLIAPFAVAQFDMAWSKLTSSHGPQTNLQSSIPETGSAGRALITPTFEVTSGLLSYLVRGNCQVFAVIDSHRLVAGPLHGSTIAGFGGTDASSFRWISHDLQRYRGKRIHLEIWPIDQSPLMIAQVIDGPPPADKPFEANDPNTVESSASASAGSKTALEEQLHPFRVALRDAKALISGQTLEQPERALRAMSVLEWLINQRSNLLSKSPAAKSDLETQLAAWRQAETAIRDTLPLQSMTAPGMIDGSGEEDFVLVRGNPQNLGEPAPRRFLAAFGNESLPSGWKGSGRRWLAEKITAKDNPQTARVAANRIWHHLLGRGIVPTVDDFGVLGESPSHVELLDHLANRLIDQEWSVKDLMRHVVLSQTYRQSSARDEDDEADAMNVLLHRANVKRMQSEVIRDSLLAVAGHLDLRQGGPSVPAYLTDFMQGRGRPGGSGPMDGNGRRSIYLAIRRNFLSPFMLTFDTPAPFSAMGRRNQSNVPAQSLIMLNDELVRAMSQQWAKDLLRTEGSDEARVQQMYLTAFGRLPSEKESASAVRFIETAKQQNVAQETAWSDLAHVLFTVKEFIYYF